MCEGEGENIKNVWKRIKEDVRVEEVAIGVEAVSSV